MNRKYLAAASVLTIGLLIGAPTFSQDAKTQAPEQTQETRPFRGMRNQKVNEAMNKARLESKDLYEKSRALRKEMDDIVKAEPFDKKAYLSKHADMQEINKKIADKRAETLATAFSNMSAKERAEELMMPRGFKGERPRGPARGGKWAPEPNNSEESAE